MKRKIVLAATLIMALPALTFAGLVDLPVGLRPVLLESISRDVNQHHYINQEDLSAVNPGNEFRFNFSAEGVEVTTDNESLQLALTAWGRTDALEEVSTVTPHALKAKVEYRREGLVEWYLNLPQGLEQGFTIKEAPAGNGKLTLKIETNVEPVEENGDLKLGGLLYSGLYAVDSEGRGLQANYRIEGRDIFIEVEDRDAVYPVIVDPLLQQQQLTASDGKAGDEFGRSVSLSDDGNTALVGAWRAAYSGTTFFNEGAAYVFVRSGTTWTEQQKLTSSFGSRFMLGSSVALSGDGNTAILGGPAVFYNIGGVAVVYQRSGTTWTEQKQLNGGQRFGSSVALSRDGNAAIVGAYQADGATVNDTAGAAFMYARIGTTWSLQQKFVANPAGKSFDLFGISSDISDDGTVAIVGASQADFIANNLGAAYIFAWNGSAWGSGQRILIPGRPATSDQDANFGASVAISGDGSTAIVGAHKSNLTNLRNSEGSAHVYTWTGTTYAWQARLKASDPKISGFFGASVDLTHDGNIALVGSDIAHAAYLYERTGSAWAESQKLSVPSGFGKFGHSVALSDDGSSALIGAFTSNVPAVAGTNNKQGAAYVFAAPAVAGPDITVNNTVTFGDVTQTTLSNRTVTITNVGTTDLIIGQIAQANPLAAPFSILNDNCSSQTITSGFNCDFVVRFSPTSIGTVNDSFDIPSNDPDENPVTVAVSGTGTPGTPDITVTDSVAPNTDLSVPFGNVTENTTATETVTVKNDGSADLGIGIVAIAGGATFSVANNNCIFTTLAPTAICTFDIQFAPTGLGAFADTVTISSNDPDESTIDISVNGTGVDAPVPDIVVSDSLGDPNDQTIAFPNLTTGVTTVEAVTIVNNGTATLNVGAIDSVGAPFSITNDNCSNTSLSVSASCFFNVVFAPTVVGSFADTITIPSDDPDEGTVEVAVSGDGLAPPNNPPNSFNLIFPANGQVDVAVPTEFRWDPATDPDGDPVTYDLFACTQSDFTECAPINTTPITASLVVKGTMFAGTGLSLMVFGFILTGDGRRRWLAAALLVTVLLAGTLFTSCKLWDWDGSENEVMFTVDTLSSDTQYYWKVVASDGTDTTDSAVWSFTTAP